MLEPKNIEKNMPGSIWKNCTSWILHDWKKMKKVIILIPVFNDWDSLIKLINEINENITDLKKLILNVLW